jgi:hypothetical protein
MSRIVVDHILGDGSPTGAAQRFAGVGIDVQSRKVAGGYVNANPVTFGESVGRGIKLDGELVGLARSHELLTLG